MDHFSPTPDDATIAGWICGTFGERRLALEAVWVDFRLSLVRILKNSFSGLCWADCEVFADDAFSQLQVRLDAGSFHGRGMSCLRNFLLRAARNDIIDAQRKAARRGRLEQVIAMHQETHAPEDYCAMVVRLECEALRRSRGDAMIAKLIACAQTMKPAQRAVAVIMIDTLVTTAYWPTNQSILEQLREKEPDLQIGTVGERRKEVRKKFRPILGDDFDDSL